MSDRYPATISILKRDIERDPEIKQMVEDYFYDANGNLMDDTWWEENSPIATFKDDEARYGIFSDLEDLLVSKNIPFDRWSAAYISDSVTSYYRPDSGGWIVANGESGEITYEASTLKNIANGVTDMAELGRRFSSFLNKIPEIKKLEEYLC